MEQTKMSFFQQQYRNFDLFESLYGIQKLLFTFLKILVTYREVMCGRCCGSSFWLEWMKPTECNHSGEKWQSNYSMWSWLEGLGRLFIRGHPSISHQGGMTWQYAQESDNSWKPDQPQKNYSCEPGSAQDFFLVKGNCFCHSCLFLQGT